MLLLRNLLYNFLISLNFRNLRLFLTYRVLASIIAVHHEVPGMCSFGSVIETSNEFELNFVIFCCIILVYDKSLVKNMFRLSDFLSNLNLGERTIKGCIEAYSCKNELVT